MKKKRIADELLQSLKEAVEMENAEKSKKTKNTRIELVEDRLTGTLYEVEVEVEDE